MRCFWVSYCVDSWFYFEVFGFWFCFIDWLFVLYLFVLFIWYFCVWFILVLCCAYFFDLHLVFVLLITTDIVLLLGYHCDAFLVCRHLLGLFGLLCMISFKFSIMYFDLVIFTFDFRLGLRIVFAAFICVNFGRVLFYCLFDVVALWCNLVVVVYFILGFELIVGNLWLYVCCLITILWLVVWLLFVGLLELVLLFTLFCCEWFFGFFGYLCIVG